MTAMKIGSSGLTVQRKRIETISSNMANAETTRTPEGGPYRRKDLVITALPLRDEFGQQLDQQMLEKVRRVTVTDIVMSRWASGAHRSSWTTPSTSASPTTVSTTVVQTMFRFACLKSSSSFTFPHPIILTTQNPIDFPQIRTFQFFFSKKKHPPSLIIWRHRGSSVKK